MEMQQQQCAQSDHEQHRFPIATVELPLYSEQPLQITYHLITEVTVAFWTTYLLNHKISTERFVSAEKFFVPLIYFC